MALGIQLLADRDALQQRDLDAEPCAGIDRLAGRFDERSVAHACTEVGSDQRVAQPRGRVARLARRAMQHRREAGREAPLELMLGRCIKRNAIGRLAAVRIAPRARPLEQLADERRSADRVPSSLVHGRACRSSASSSRWRRS
jgi:hypothetical protein